MLFLREIEETGQQDVKSQPNQQIIFSGIN